MMYNVPEEISFISTQLSGRYVATGFFKAVSDIERGLLPYLGLNESTYAKIKKKTLEAMTSGTS
jgi:hypothetical protein